MKRAELLTASIADPDNIRLAAWKAAKGKRYTPEVLNWFKAMDLHLPRLREQILNAEVQVGRYRYFTVYEPKERKICASAFDEQVLHHALMNVCHDYFERYQIQDSYASRKEKGTYAALARARGFNGAGRWFLKLDVRKFFESAHHDVIKTQLTRLFKDHRLLDIFFQIIDSYEAHPSRGLPIGNLTSQYLANHYLAGLDHFIKEKLRMKAYVRYMDDMVLWHTDKNELKTAKRVISDFLHDRLSCELKPSSLQRTENGLPFLGYHIFPYHLRLLQKSKVRFLKKMNAVDENYHSGQWSEAKCQRSALALLAFAANADTKKLRKNLLLRRNGQSP